MADGASNLLFKLDEKVVWWKSIMFGGQHVFVAFAAMIGTPLALASMFGMPSNESIMLINGVMLASGVTTILQCLGPWQLGARLPMVEAATFKFIPPLAMAYAGGGMAAVMGAAFLGGLVEIGLSFGIERIRKIFNPFLMGTVITVLGVSLIPVGITIGLDVGGPLQGNPVVFLLIFFTLAMIFVFNIFTRGTLKAASILVAIALGYGLAGILGLIDLTPVREAKWIGFTIPFVWGFPRWPGITPLIAVIIVYVVSLIETVGDTAALSAICEVEATPSRVRRAITVDGLSGPIAAIFNGAPCTSFTQDIGLVQMTGVASRYVVAVGGAIFILLGLLPKLGALVFIMPAPVLGAVLMLTFATIATVGIRRVAPELDSSRNQMVLSLSIAITIGIAVAPKETWANVPEMLQPFLSEEMIMGILFAVFLDLIIPKDKGPIEKRREEAKAA